MQHPMALAGRLREQASLKPSNGDNLERRERSNANRTAMLSNWHGMPGCILICRQDVAGSGGVPWCSCYQPAGWQPCRMHSI